jgi:hypothetical protein
MTKGPPIAYMVRAAGRYPAGSPGGRGGRFRRRRRRFVWSERNAKRFEALGFERVTGLAVAMRWQYEQAFLRTFKEASRCIGIGDFVGDRKVEWFRYPPPLKESRP